MILRAGYLRIIMQRTLKAMTQSKINNFRTALESIAGELDGTIRQREDIFVEGSADALDRILRANEREMAVRNLEAASNRSREVQGALSRIEHGSFGVCQECDNEISLLRLTAVPWAALCIRCQQLADRKSAVRRLVNSLPMAA